MSGARLPVSQGHPAASLSTYSTSSCALDPDIRELRCKQGSIFSCFHTGGAEDQKPTYSIGFDLSMRPTPKESWSPRHDCGWFA